MTDTVIRVENLGKKYTIGHQRERYTALRDVMANTARQWGRRLAFPFPHNGAGGDQTKEEIWALRDVSFEVKRGERLGIIGRNGAGKSTLLKILSRITEPSAGRVRLRGRVASLLEVGTGFHPELTGRENIYLNGAILGMTRAEIRRKFDEIVAFAEVEKFLDTPVKRYSSGMYVRLAFAVAAHLEPEVLLVDEVLAVGDVAFQKKCLGRMGEVAKEGRTVLFVSHNMAAIESLCSHSVLLNHGYVANIGETRQITALYLDQMQELHGLRLKSNGVIKDVESQDVSGITKDTFQIGEPIRILLRLDTGTDEIKTPVVGIGFNTNSNQRVFTVGTYFSTDELPPICGHISIVCEIPSPSLAPGDYFIKVALGRDLLHTFESIENAASIHIVPSDFYGTGRLPTAKQGFVVVRSTWRVSK